MSTTITISVPLTRADRQQAQAFKELQPNSEKAEQIHENTLAVLATRRYLDMINIPTDLKKSYSQNPIAFLTANVADIYIPEAKGRLECRAVRPEDQACFMPEEVWRNGEQGDRIGYVMVRLNETNTEAIVLGFVQEVLGQELPFDALKSLDDLVEAINDCQLQVLTADFEVEDNVLDAGETGRASNNIVPAERLSQRLKEQSNKFEQGINYDPGWRSPKELIEGFRGMDMRSASDAQNSIPLFEEAKALELGQETNSPIFLIRRIVQRSSKEELFDLSVILSSASASEFLPTGL